MASNGVQKIEIARKNRTMNKDRMIAYGLILLLIVRLLAMVWVPLTDPTEARYAEIARKMVETGNWITPQFDYGIPFWAKPPLHTWLSALGIAAFGPTAFAARLGILLATIATLAILWRWGCAVSTRRTASVAVLMTASSGLFFVSAAFVQTDMVLTLGVVASMAGFYGGLKGERRWGWLFFLGIAIGLLGKGPVAVVLSSFPILVWMAWRGGWRDLRRLPWVGGIALCTVLVVPWYVLAEAATPGFLRYFLIGEHIERFLQPGWTGDLYGSGREHTKGTIWLFWIVATLPWSPLLPLLIWRQRKASRAKDDGLGLYLLLFALTPLIFFTAAANILIAYVLPGVPAAALLAAIRWKQAGGKGGNWLVFGVGEIVIIAVGLIAISPPALNTSLLPSEERLLDNYSSSHRIAMLYPRSFSAEFYTRGKIVKLKTVDELASWLAPGDEVLVHQDQQSKVEARLGATLEPVAADKDYVLFVCRSGVGT